MTRHVKASSARSNTDQGPGPRSFFRGALATRGALDDATGSGAPSSRLFCKILVLCLTTVAAMALLVAPAMAITIESTSASAVTTTEATMHAALNPQGLATSYHFEYGPNTSYGQSTTQGGAGSDETVHAVAKTLQGLTPGTIYHYRVVADNTAETLPGPDRTFTTYRPSSPATNCPNQAFRVGAGANLPDCRGYEMVSPVDKNGGDVAPFFGAGDVRAAFNQAAVSGDEMTYSSGTPFGDVKAGRNSNQYLATRGANGWTTRGINAPVNGVVGEPIDLLYPLETAFKLFTPDLSSAWIQDASVPTLTADAAQGAPNLYRDHLDGSYEALTNQEAHNVPTSPFELEYGFHLGGHSSDFRDILFNVTAAMTADAFQSAQGNESQTYDSADGDLHLVSVLPDGRAYPGPSEAAAMSADGSLAFWNSRTRIFDDGYESVSVFLRKNPTQPQSALAHGSALGHGDVTAGSNEVTGVTASRGAFAVGQSISNYPVAGFIPSGTTIIAVGPNTLTLSANAIASQASVPLETASECTEPDKACTVAISDPFARQEARQAHLEFASTDGSKAFFSIVTGQSTNNELGASPKDLYEFDTASGTSTLIAHEVLGMVGISEDASRFYFVSREDLAAGATDGELNLYLDQNGAEAFIATLAPRDVHGGPEGEFEELTTTILGRGRTRGNRLSPDGRHLIFMSKSKALAERVAGYDNTDALSGKEDREVYLYEAGGELLCISCNPSGARPHGSLLEESFIEPSHGLTFAWAAAWIPGWEHEFLAQRAMTPSGNRVFFNSFDPLVPGDSNGAQDVYEWERPGTGDCTDASSSFSEQNGGCINLISSGQSPQISEFVDASPDGHDVFITTGSSLVPQDPGLVDVYDARESGGFPQATATAVCEGEACQGTPSPPNDATPASSSYNGPANIKAPAQKKKQKKHKKKSKKKHQRAAHTNRRNHR